MVALDASPILPSDVSAEAEKIPRLGLGRFFAFGFLGVLARTDADNQQPVGRQTGRRRECRAPKSVLALEFGGARRLLDQRLAVAADKTRAWPCPSSNLRQRR